MNNNFNWMNQMDFTKIDNIGKTLRYLRISRMKSSQKLAKIMNIPNYKMSKIELKGYKVSNEKIIKALKFFDVSKDNFNYVNNKVNDYPFSELERKLRVEQRQNFQKNLKYVLLKNNYSTKEFSELINAKISTIQRWLSGFSIPNKNNWEDTFVKTLGLSIEEIEGMGLTDEQYNFVIDTKRKLIHSKELTDFGINLHYFRFTKKYTIEQLAEKADCSTSNIMQWERGINNKTGDKKPSKDLLRKISNALRITQKELLSNNEDRNKKFYEIEKERQKKLYAVQVNLKAEMLKNFWTQKKLSQKLNVPSSKIRSWINGESYPNDVIIKNICHKLNISVRKFFDPKLIKQNEKIISLYKASVVKYTDF